MMSRKRPQPHQSSRSPPNILKRKSDDAVGNGNDLSPSSLAAPARKESPHCSKNEAKRQRLHNQTEHTSEELVVSVRSDQLTCLPPLAVQRHNPLPSLSWGDQETVWTIMLEKDTLLDRGKNIEENHPSLNSRMRSILLDWLIEVCEVYRLSRDSYYKALDFTDRYIAAQYDLPKQQLQLIGITALFVATKLEEIYPPKLKEFAYVTDGACTEAEIQDLEFIMLKILKWKLTPLTPNHWLNIYMQLLSKKDEVTGDGDCAVAAPTISGQSFLEVALLMDLCMLDEGCHLFAYRVIAAGAIYHMLSPTKSFAVSGLTLEELKDCIEWQRPFYVAVSASLAETETSKNAATQGRSDEIHTFQVHTINLDMLDKAQEIQQSQQSEITLTPPISSEKTRRKALSC